MVVLLGDEPEPAVYLVPSLDWADASPPLNDRDYAGGKSEPEYGIEVGALLTFDDGSAGQYTRALSIASV